MDFILIWFICGIVAAMIGSRKGDALGAFFGGILFGPLGILITIFSKGNRKDCPYCKELIQKKATVCPHCQKEITGQKA